MHDRKASWNPITGPYRTRDRRFIHLNMMEGDRYWPDLYRVIGQPELIDDPRYIDMAARKINCRDCVEALDAIFAARDYAEWCVVLQDAKGVWAPMQTPHEVRDDPPGDLARPVRWPQRPTQRAPELGEHTETALLALGLGWDEIIALKERRVIG